MATIEQDLQAQGFALRETHISRVFLAEDLVYKLKKPVQLGFLDFTSLERREHYCHAEVTLNRRLAPGVYLGVVPVTRDAQGVHRVRGEGEVVDYAVEMRRLSDDDAADVRLRAGRLGHDELERIAVRIARFHAEARCDTETERFGTRSVIEGNVRENFEQTRDSAPLALALAELSALEQWQLRFLRERERVFAERIARGRIRDGHGDLRLEHCYLHAHGEVEIIDCIEFNERFRYADVCADIAFLAMDLSWHERSDLSEALVAYYARESGDYDLYALLDFYQSYRAYVRGKVSSIMEQSADSEDARSRAHAQARKYYLLSEACTREPLAPPRLLAVGGYIAAGKSTAADRLGRLLSAPVISSDRLRKQLAGVQPTQPLRDGAFRGEYAPEKSEQVYAELLRLGEVVLASGRSVVLDASFSERKQRDALRALAERRGVAFRFIECWAPEDVITARLAERAKGPSVSDGRSEVFEAFKQRYEPLRDGEGVRLDTTRDVDAALTAFSRA
ncbi:MAG TPA: AAA family ATPase [Polyangiales bacterium]|nr:AAA family ATPase [Polyangiales bacterium]